MTALRYAALAVTIIAAVSACYTGVTHWDEANALRFHPFLAAAWALLYFSAMVSSFTERKALDQLVASLNRYHDALRSYHDSVRAIRDPRSGDQ